MKKCLFGQATEITSVGQGESCSLVVNQESTDPGGWVIDLFAVFRDGGAAFVKRVAVTTVAASNAAARVAAMATVPGATHFSARVRSGAGSGPAIDVGLFCSNVPATNPATVVP